MEFKNLNNYNKLMIIQHYNNNFNNNKYNNYKLNQGKVINYYLNLLNRNQDNLIIKKKIKNMFFL